jgi:cell wall-associated NlpC family hydrolase
MGLRAENMAGGQSQRALAPRSLPLRIHTAPYVGLKFVDGGRDRSGVDCWGLVRLVLLEVAQVEVPSYGEISAEDLVAVAREIGSGKDGEVWLPTLRPRALDVVVMYSRVDRRRHTTHCGIMVDDHRLLHIEKTHDAVVVALKHASVANRIQGYYRHVELA